VSGDNGVHSTFNATLKTVATQSITAYIPVMIFAFLFGLSMDYEVFILARMREEYDRTGSTSAAVVNGITKTVEAHGDDLPPDELAKLRAMLGDHTERLTRMLEDLLDLSRLDAKAIKIEPTRVDVREKIEEVVASIAGERAGEVGIEVEPGLCPLVDPRALDRILGNLVANALNYGEGPVRIKAAQNDRHFRLSVEDAGEGVAPAFVPQLFDRFSRGNHGADDGDRMWPFEHRRDDR